MIKILFVVLLLLTFCMANAEIKQHIEYGSVDSKYDDGRVIYGSVDFEEFPGPLKPVRVNFSLEVVKPLPKETETAEWHIKIYYFDNVTQIVGDTLFYWPGLHTPGNRFTGSFEFVPLKSGLHTICLARDGHDGLLLPLKDNRLISFQYCIDEEGELHFLDKYLVPNHRERTKENCWTIKTFFIPSDSIIMRQFPSGRETYAFEYEIKISPIPKIGDSSRITYRFKANENLPTGCNLDIVSTGMEIVSKPQKIDMNLNKDQYLEYYFDFVPKSIKGENSFMLDLRYISAKDSDRISTQGIQTRFVFNSDGSLRYINDQPFGNFVPYPENFPELDPIKDRNRIKLEVLDLSKYRKK